MRSLGSSASRVLKSTCFCVIKCEISGIRVNSCAKHGRCFIREVDDICVVKTDRDSMPDCWCCAGLNDDRVQK